MAAVIYALREWRCSLEGALTPFTIETDHQPNTDLDTSAHPSHRVHLPAPWHREHNVFHVASLKKYHSNGTYQPLVFRDVRRDDFELTVDHFSIREIHFVTCKLLACLCKFRTVALQLAWVHTGCNLAASSEQLHTAFLQQ